MEKLSAWCERSTPLDRPDVPDDQRITAVREGASKWVGFLSCALDGQRRVFQSVLGTEVEEGYVSVARSTV